ncbi:MAG TPA: D-alanyl-D-alanine carboxypeptidase [Deltaproteobacteria bacterium]|nr:D-alanyl-D-alanine carboxypeptidase [Deltaproteobacteria bacterium]
MRSLPRLPLGLLLLGLASFTPDPPVPAPERELEPAPAPAPAVATIPIQTIPQPSWRPPLWFPEEARDELWVIEGLDGEPLHRWGPRVNSHAAILADLDRGEILWARDPDGPRGIASVTKLVSSLTLSSSPVLDLSRPICLGLEQWPSRPGARSKFETGDCHEGWEYLGAALISSDNRGAFALPAVAGDEYFSFVDRMHEVARELGMQRASFGDPAGLQDENRASPRDVAKAVTAVALHPTLSSVASASSWLIEPSRGDRRLITTNRLLRNDSGEFDILAAKTGYTDTARYCFAAVVQSRTTGRRFAVVVLAAPNNKSRYNDVLNMIRWADQT